MIWKVKKPNQQKTGSVGSAAKNLLQPRVAVHFLMKVLKDFKTEMFGEFMFYKAKKGKLATSVNCVSNKLDDNTHLFKEFKAELAAVKKENAELRNQVDSISRDFSFCKA